jgi:hypothetical protein
VIFNFLGSAYAYQDGDVVLIFKNDAQRNEEIRNPRAKETLTSEAAKTKVLKRKGQPKVQHDWIAELSSRKDYQMDAHKFWHQIDPEKMVHAVTDGGTNPNSG